MTIEQIVTSKEVSQQLADAGIKHETLFYWVKPFDINNQYTGEPLELYGLDWLEHFEMEKSIVYPAYTASELLDILPDNVSVFRYVKGQPVLKQFNAKYHVYEYENEIEFTAYLKKGRSPANALGRLVLYLSKEGIL